MPAAAAISTSWLTWCVFSSERCMEEMGRAPGSAAADAGAEAADAGADSGRGVDERTASGGTAWGLLILFGMCARKFFWALDNFGKSGPATGGALVSV
jgi:hypothetical protein